MTSTQKVIKIGAIALGLLLVVGIVSGVVSVIGMIAGFGESAVNDEITAYEVSDNVTELIIEVGAASLTVEESDSFGVESNLRWLTVTDSNGRLKVVERSHKGADYKDAILKVCIPKDFVFDKIEITSGAGELSADTLRAKNVSLEFGAGKIEIDGLYASSSVEIESGAGEVNINGGELPHLDLSIGAGKANIKAKLTGSCDLEFGVGGADIILLGDESDYTLRIDMGVGVVRVDGKSIANSTTIGNGAARIEMDCGVGSINVSFSK